MKGFSQSKAAIYPRRIPYTILTNQNQRYTISQLCKRRFISILFLTLWVQAAGNSYAALFANVLEKGKQLNEASKPSIIDGSFVLYFVLVL